MAERFEIVEKALLKMLDEKKYASLRDILVTMNPSDVAGLFDGLEEKQIPVMFRLLPKEQAAETFVEMEPEAQQLLIQGFSDNELREVLDELYVDDAADLVEEMPANVVRRILTQADPEMRSSINQILRYPENSAGALMTMEYVSLRLDMTVEESILRIRRQGVDKETIYTCYVLSADRTLQGIVTVKDLLLAESDDTEIKEIMTENVISVTTQDDQEEVYLFHDTIANNIRFGQPDAPMEKVVAAAKKARCHDFILKLPQGYETVIGEAGGTLSGGERQRLSIARAMMKDAPIIILDEATANVDPENEKELMEAIQELTQEKTVIMIAHRLKTVRHANQILVVDKGQIVQCGTHDELMVQDGIYRHFISGREKAVGWKL